jgi:hypothetical protein
MGLDFTMADIPSASFPTTSIRYRLIDDLCRARCLQTTPHAGADMLGASRRGRGAGPARTSPWPERPNHWLACRMNRSREKSA